MLKVMLNMTYMSPVWEIAVHLDVTGDVFDGVFFAVLFPHEISDLIDSVSECFPAYSYSNPKLKSLLLRNRMASESGEAPQNRSSISESCVKSTFNISSICTMSS